MCGEHSGHLGDDSKKQQSDPLRAAKIFGKPLAESWLNRFRRERLKAAVGRWWRVGSDCGSVNWWLPKGRLAKPRLSSSVFSRICSRLPAPSSMLITP